MMHTKVSYKQLHLSQMIKRAIKYGFSSHSDEKKYSQDYDTKIVDQSSEPSPVCFEPSPSIHLQVKHIFHPHFQTESLLHDLPIWPQGPLTSDLSVVMWVFSLIQRSAYAIEDNI